MALRVIGGRAHGRSLGVPRGGRTRPTSGLVRGALLNMLEQRGWLADGIRMEQDLYVLLQTTADRREGVRAFLERRPPRFAGR